MFILLEIIYTKILIFFSVMMRELVEQERVEEAVKMLSREGYSSDDAYWTCVMSNVMRHFDYR